MRKIAPALIILYLLLFVSLGTQILSGFFMKGSSFLYSLHTINIWVLMVLVVLHWIAAITKVRVWINRKAMEKSAQKKSANQTVNPSV